jgi:phage/plasmid-associated DNA primase
MFLEWLEDAFYSESERRWFIDWWAYQLQSPGVKLNTALMLVGPSGVGKGWMAGIAERIFGGDNTWKCNLSDLESRFNSGLSSAQLLIVEEADVSGGTRIYNVLKDLITNEHIRYERKGIDAIKIANVLNVFLNSNHIGVLRLDEFDRRFAVLEITNQSIANDKYYWQPKWDWIKQEGGAAEIMGWLLEYRISDTFDPFGEAPWTQAKLDMIEVTHKPIDTWVQEHIVRGEELTVQGKDVFEKIDTDLPGFLVSAKELAWCFNEGRIDWGDVERSDSMRMVKALNDARIAVANQGKKIKWDGQSTKFYWVGMPGIEGDYQHQLQNRQFWVSLVASLRGEVASKY